MDKITLSEAIKVLADYGAPFWVGLFSAVVVFVVEIILCTKGTIFASGDKKISMAKKAGNMFTATMYRLRYTDRGPKDNTANRMYVAQYEYYVGGKRATKQVVTNCTKPPQFITVYYLKSPHKTFTEYDVGKKPLKILIYIIPILVAYAVMTALGFRI